jgi:hypothetical protein
MLALAMALAAGRELYAADCAVTVSLTNPSAVPGAELIRAKDVAADLFAGIGVELRWAGHNQRVAGCSVRVEIELTVSAGPADRPGSLGYASVGVEADKAIHVFLDRVHAMVPPAERGALLGHVLAHEITHILEGVPRHSDSGVMKARWEPRDLRELARRPLHFALVDDGLIHAGLNQAGLAAVE